MKQVLQDQARRVIAAGLSPIRSRSTHWVLWTSPKMRGGNYLYQWLRVWRQREEGVTAWVLHQPGMDVWLEMFPRLRELTIERSDVGTFYHRFYDDGQLYRSFGDQRLMQFIREYLLSSDSFAALIAHKKETLAVYETPLAVLNIRRGDYYSVPEFYRDYGMNIRKYVLAALEQMGHVKSLHIVSDGIEWCRETVPQWVPDLTLGYEEQGPKIFGDLATLAAAQRLILTNSTFSYWGGYLSEVVAADAGVASSIWAPSFHVRGMNGGRSWHLAPSWCVVDNAQWEQLPPEDEKGRDEPQ
ncbi:hypothetical protein BSZ39_12435 [Bowdeniella nasicola]|uniref:Glycosyl transferase family 11 n=1 Tax=Bowdeniella nasicola TaxID=208480 RepID=A0A1Q5PZ45_9ACTO|nr:alpha-1,2-fucosyltransferase [Bowdeniella nasicola]OKL52901.1 hypothetical protein BSZ39_12435 [Bowdeniella nasicola]